MGYIERVLIIDDDETSIFLTRRILSSMGIGSDVQTALNGLDGLKLLSEAKKKKQLPQLILLDVRMQGIDGFTFLEELGRLGYVNLIDTKIVLLSNSKDPKDIRAAQNHMAAAYLEKPLTKEKLHSVLNH